MLRFLRRLLCGVLAAIGLLTVLLAAGVGFMWWQGYWRETATLPERIVLVADLRGSLAEAPRGVALLDLGLGGGPTVSEVTMALDRAAEDARIVAVVGLLDESTHGLAVAQELRDAIGRVRRAGKPTFAWADSFGELGPGNEGYYIATAFEEILLQPIGVLGLTGLSIETPFAAEALARLGVFFQVQRRSEFKTALDPLHESAMSAPQREMLEALVSDLSSQLAGAIATGRRLPEARARQLLTGGPYTALEARELGLIDALLYRDEAFARVAGRASGAEEVALGRYAALRANEPVAAEPAAKVALIRAEGPIVREGGESGFTIGADDLAQTIGDVAKDDAIDAIVLRLDTPGGSAVASATVGRAIAQARKAGKPVVVSMGNTAASGGYWIAMGATRIIAQPATLTGSIGVVSGKPVLQGLWDRLGVRWATVDTGGNAGIFSINHPYTPAEQERLDAVLDGIYAAFKDGVAAGRDLPPQRVEALARGRVWTGTAGLGLGLVDELGGLDRALAAVRGLLGLPEDALLDLVVLPERPSPLERVFDLLSGQIDVLGSIAGRIGAGAWPGGILSAPHLRAR